jgi:hypothetical protein
MVMILAGDFLQLRKIQMPREIIKMKHRVVPAVFAEKRDVLTEVHVLQMVGDKAAVASLDPLAKIADDAIRMTDIIVHYEDFII